MRRKRIVENKQRNLLEQRKQNPGSVGQKCSEQINVSTLLIKLSIEWWKIAWKKDCSVQGLCSCCKLCPTTEI